jgi:hypothetical protein
VILISVPERVQQPWRGLSPPGSAGWAPANPDLREFQPETDPQKAAEDKKFFLNLLLIFLITCCCTIYEKIHFMT